jgi:hypothetical protein
MSEAATIEEFSQSRYIQFPSGDIALGEKAIVDAIMNQVYAADQQLVFEVQEAVAQLFDALEEKGFTNEYAEGIAEPYQLVYPDVAVQALGASALELGKLAEFLNVEYNAVDVAIAQLAGLQEDLDDERVTVEVLEDTLTKQVKNYSQINAVNKALNDELVLQKAQNCVLQVEVRDLKVSLDIMMNIETRLREDIRSLKFGANQRAA